MGEKLISPKFRCSFLHVFEPQESMTPGGERKFSVVMLFPKSTDLSALKAAAKAAAMEMWPDGKRPANFRSPFRDGDTKELEGYKDHIFVTASSKSKPGVVDQNVQPILDANDFVSGDYAIASINAYAYNKSGNAGVSFGLGNIQLVAKGTPFGSRSKPSDDFTAVAGAQAAKKAAVKDEFDEQEAAATAEEPPF